MLGSKIAFFFCVAGLAGCGTRVGGWQEVTLDLPGATEDVVYLRKPMPNVWVGTEQYRRLKTGGRVLELPGQMGGRDPVNVYLLRDSAHVVLQLVEQHETTSVDIETLASWGSTGTPAVLGEFVGALVSPEIRDLRFVPAPEGGPVAFD